MEIQIPFNFTTSLLLFLTLVLFIVKILLKSPSTIRKLPPGPWKLPIIGHLHHLVGTLPHHRFRDLAQKHGPFIHLELGESSVFVASSPKFAEAILKTVDPACADRPQSQAIKIMWWDYKDIAFSPYNEYWKQMRMICTQELLSTKNVRSFECIRKDEASRLVESVRSAAGKPINLSDMTSLFSITITCRARMLVNVWSMGRDPEYWVEPEEFRPERFEDNPVDYLGAHFQYLPFGSGRRSCPGVSFAWANMETPLAHLLYHFDWSLPDGMKPSDLDMAETEGITAGRKEKLVVVPTPHCI